MSTIVRSTMADLITRCRLMIADPAGTAQQFDDGSIQQTMDEYRDDIRYESLKIAPSIVNTASTGNQASTIFANYYSHYQWWEADVVLQGIGPPPTSGAWIVLTPLASDYIVGRWQFELNEFVSGTVPGQLPPVFATGKVYDLNATAADLLEFWAAFLSAAYNVSVDGQSLQRSQLMTAKLTLAAQYRRKARMRTVPMLRDDILAPISSKRMRLLDEGDSAKWGGS